MIPAANDVPHHLEMPELGTHQFAENLDSSTVSVPTDCCKPNKPSWPRKIHIVLAGIICTFNTNLGSSMPSGALVAISQKFSITNSLLLVLLNSIYMAGYVLGPLLFGPMSEYLGRRPVLIGTFIGYLIFMACCSVAPNYTALVVFRLLCGISASAPHSIVGGLYSDIFDNPSHRGTAMSLYMSAANVGPLLGPLISGFSSQISWRWPFLLAVLIALPGLPLVLLMPETYAPVLYDNAVRKHRKQGAAVASNQRSTSPRRALDPREVFVRPAKLICTEPILLFTSLYIALAYAIMYLTFQAYYIIYQEHYGLSPGIAGLAYVPILIGVTVAFTLGLVYTWWHDKACAAGKSWTQQEVYRRLPIACFAAPCLVTSSFWIGWTAWPGATAPIVPMIGGLFFGLGSQLVYIAMINYITDIYRERSASAHAAASVTRSVGAVLLPLAARPMYRDLGIHWAPSLLGLLSFVIGIIPFLLVRYGDKSLANQTLQASPWPMLLRSDTSGPSHHVRRQVQLLSPSVTVLAILGAIAGVVTPLGLGEKLISLREQGGTFEYSRDITAKATSTASAPTIPGAVGFPVHTRVMSWK
ncbi:Major facilitator superfamily domain, general substrate transporter [Metarhizium album ARSEF 1941]|uniref:Major facilitator superfamily domain, general substrate transporter n=1 Tax=Metarhizium album (strain ARSEF 1941) TaxID=1081103 RepID=A0A0B2WV24_METAS|nr:Major facilitator superfamily domain, general substrate transporter [Metarhizium album ARSEF 1941]KHN97504.1 Major facilitator superfamily domain, general substrate transporter [Metarhizium album ARSEF 1941]